MPGTSPGMTAFLRFRLSWLNERPRMTSYELAKAPALTSDREGSAAIEVARLTKLYKATRAVDDISFAIAQGSITGLLGGNGAGKTTTIAMIMGLVLPTSGKIQVLGCPMPEQSAAVLGRMNFESPYVDMPMRLTVRQNLTISAGSMPSKIYASGSSNLPPISISASSSTGPTASSLPGRRHGLRWRKR